MFNKMKNLGEQGLSRGQKIFATAMSKMPSILPKKVKPQPWPEGAMSIRVYFRVEIGGLEPGMYSLTIDPDMLSIGIKTYSVFVYGVTEPPLRLTEDYWRTLVENQRVAVVHVPHH